MAQLNFAVSVIAEFMVTVAVAVVIVNVPVHEVNTCPVLAVALIVTLLPALCQPLLGITEPGPLELMVRKNW